MATASDGDGASESDGRKRPPIVCHHFPESRLAGRRRRFGGVGDRAGRRDVRRDRLDRRRAGRHGTAGKAGESPS